jgi:hypothetical protein
MYTQKTLINIEGTGHRGPFSDLTASEAIAAGDLVVKDTEEMQKMVAADVHSKLLWIAEEKNYGVNELTTYSQTPVLTGYEIGDPVHRYKPDHDHRWAVNVYNSTGGDLLINEGQYLVNSPTQAGKLEVSPAIDGATVTKTLIFRAAETITIPTVTSVLVKVWYKG